MARTKQTQRLTAAAAAIPRAVLTMTRPKSRPLRVPRRGSTSDASSVSSDDMEEEEQEQPRSPRAISPTDQMNEARESIDEIQSKITRSMNEINEAREWIEENPTPEIEAAGPEIVPMSPREIRDHAVKAAERRFNEMYTGLIETLTPPYLATQTRENAPKLFEMVMASLNDTGATTGASSRT